MGMDASFFEEKALRLHQALARDLGVAILTGKFKPGDALGSEIEESAAHQVSRTAYREAMRILVAKGLLESKPKAGTRVMPRARWNMLDPDVLSWMFSSEPDKDFVRDLFELRLLLEPAAAALAAERRSSDDLAKMHAAIGGMRRHGLATAEGRAADQQFHRALIEASGNEAVSCLASTIAAAVNWTTFFKHRRSKKPADRLPDHEKVLAAIESANPVRARKAMKDLIDAALTDMGNRR